ncbi:MAG TPA: hypothetical protein VGK67_39755 [Myxococcales bacterium]|jgi:mono/diheme cytochrome c family protein
MPARARGGRLRPALAGLLGLLASGCAPKEPGVSPAGQWFVQKGCAQCHTIASLGVRGRPTAAPDLSVAAEDVPRRYGVSLEQFLDAPRSGTMAIVLSVQIRLTPEERAAAARGLREALQRHRGGRDGSVAP